ncbi:unnamed protein product, partial [Polarella glacialis]
MPVGAPDPYFLQACILKEEKLIDKWAAGNAAGEDFRRTERLNPKEMKYLARVNKTPFEFSSRLTKKDKELLEEFNSRPVAAQHEMSPPFAAGEALQATTTYRAMFRSRNEAVSSKIPTSAPPTPASSRRASG